MEALLCDACDTCDVMRGRQHTQCRNTQCEWKKDGCFADFSVIAQLDFCPVGSISSRCFYVALTVSGRKLWVGRRGGKMGACYFSCYVHDNNSEDKGISPELSKTNSHALLHSKTASLKAPFQDAFWFGQGPNWRVSIGGTF